MPNLPADWTALCLLAFLLGLRHGLDADHLAAIDGLTRANWRRTGQRVRSCGVLFSLGHGCVILPVAALTGSIGAQWAPPAWFEWLGGLISIGFLALIGIVNLLAVLRSSPQAPVALVGLRGRWLQRLMGCVDGHRGTWSAAGVGFLFALSFDTLSQSALFAAMAVKHGGTDHALVLGGLFVAGMLASDGLNGWWIAHLIGRTDRVAVLASRVMTLVVAGISLLVATLGALRMASDHFEGWLDGKELAIGLVVIGLTAAGYGAACWMAARQRVRAAA